MRAVIQRVEDCSVSVNGSVTGAIERGILVYLGVEKEDTDADLSYMVRKVSGLRIFEDAHGKMNLSVKDAGGDILVVSQFTICADTRKGNRPSYNNAADPEIALIFYNRFVEELKNSGFKVATGIFQATMDVSYVNKGPVTIMIDSRKRF